MSGGDDNKVKETEYEKEMAQIASEKWDRYKSTYRPVENEYMAQVDDMGSQGAYDRAIGGATLAVQQGAGAPGLNPNANSGASVGRGLATARAGAAGNATNAVRGNYGQGMASVAAMGQGQSADAMKSFGDMATQAASDAMNKAERKFNTKQSWLNTAGTVGGAAAGANWGDKKTTGSIGDNSYYGSQDSMPMDNINAGTFDNPGWE